MIKSPPPQPTRIFCSLLLLGTTIITSAQNPIWLVGNNKIDFSEASTNGLSMTALPSPNDPNVSPAYQYQGQVGQYSQNIQVDDRGEILFFTIDGRIYDRDGYMIADSDLDPSCIQCVQYGSSEMLVAPVPGKCTQFYLITNRKVSQTQEYDVRFLVLDMTLPGLLVPWRRGALLMSSQFNSNYPTYDYLDHGFNFSNVTTPNVFQFGLDIPESSTDDHQGLHMDIAMGQYEGEHLLFITDGALVSKFWLGSSDVTHTGTDEMPFPSETSRRVKGELEVSATDTLRVAYTQFNAVEINQFLYWIIYGVKVIDYMINYPDVDPLGRESGAYQIAEGRSLLELDLSGLARGVYTLVLRRDGNVAATTRLTLAN